MKLGITSAACTAVLFSLSLAAQNASVNVVHGVPGLGQPVDVFANNNFLFTFDFGDQQGPLSLAPGAYAIDVRLGGSTILSTNAMLAAGDDVTLLANLDGAGSPTLSSFANDRSALTLPSSRLTVRHTAAAPTVDVLLEQNGTVVGTLASLSNGQEQGVDVPPGVYSARINAAGTTTTAFGPVPLRLEDGYSYAVHAIGDLAGGSFGLAVQRIDLTARVAVLHGIPGLPVPVDVQANGSTLFSFDFDDYAGPLVLNGGTYNLDVVLNGQSVLGAPATVAAGDDVTVVAHLDGAGANTLSIFADDFSPISAGNDVRVTARHLAAAPAVDIAVDNQGVRLATIPALTNGNEAVADLPAGLYQVSLLAAGTNTVVAGPLPWKAAVGTHYFFHAIGDLNGGSFTINESSRDLSPGVAGALAAATSGTGCAGQISSDKPTFEFGEPFTVSLIGGPANAVGWLNLGDDIARAGNVALPFDGGAIGAPGCFLYTNLVADHPLALDGGGNAAVELVVPAALFSSFQPAYLQFVVATNNSLGFGSSDLLTINVR